MKLPVTLCVFFLACTTLLQAQSGIHRVFIYETDTGLFQGEELTPLRSSPGYLATAKKHLPVIVRPSLPGLFSTPSLLRTSGSVSMETRYANLQHPYSRAQLFYSRFSYQGTISIAGLPFRSQAFYTTENTVYNASYVTLQFDKRLFDQQVKEQVNKELKVLNKRDQFNRLLTEQLETVLDNQAKKLSAEKEKLALGKDSLVRKYKREMPEIPDSLRQRSPEQALKDSLGRYRTTPVNPLDTSQALQKAQQEIDLLQARADSLKGRYTELREKIAADSARIVKYRNLLESPGNLVSDSLAGRFPLDVSRLEKLQVGTAMLQYDAFSLYGLSLRGVDILLNTGKMVVGGSAGRTFNSGNTFLSGKRPSYDRNLAGVRFGRQKNKNNYLIGSFFYADDAKKVVNGMRNTVFSVDWKMPFKKLLLEGTAATSNYTQDEVTLAAAPSEISSNLLADKAFSISATYAFLPSANTKMAFRQIGNAFYTVGNPYLRRNFSEINAELEKSFFKRKIVSAVSYKELKTLTSTNEEIPDKIKGYGLRVASAFSKVPNFFVVYTPYEQGNNHPDTLFRTFSRTSLFIAGLNWFRNFKQLQWSSSLTYTRADILSDRLPPTRTQTFSCEQTLGIGGNTEIRLEFTTNRTQPNLDSLNSDGISAGLYHIFSQQLKAGFSSRIVKYHANSSIAGIQSSADWQINKKYGVGFRADVDRVNNWWGVEGKKTAFNCLVSFRHSW